MKRGRMVRLPQSHIDIVICIQKNESKKKGKKVTFADAARIAASMLESSMFRRKRR